MVESRLNEVEGEREEAKKKSDALKAAKNKSDSDSKKSKRDEKPPKAAKGAAD